MEPVTLFKVGDKVRYAVPYYGIGTVVAIDDNFIWIKWPAFVPNIGHLPQHLTPINALELMADV